MQAGDDAAARPATGDVRDDRPALADAQTRRRAPAEADRERALEELRVEVERRRAAEAALRKAHEELEARVRVSTLELRIANDWLRRELAQRAAVERELRRSNADLEQFAYAASHDLQEPLRMIASFLQLLERRYRGRLDAAADEYIAFAVDGAKRMQTLIEDLLAYSRAGRPGAVMERVDAEDVLQATLRNLRKAIEESGVEITWGALPVLNASASQLGQVFQNLIANAITFRRAVDPRIRIDAERIDNAWQFSVRDNGLGIAPEFHERIFAIFQRLNRREEYAGNGIGLAVAKKIVERHGGRIWVESTLGNGATFFFTIHDPEVD